MAERVSFEKLGPIISDKRPAGQATWIITITGLIGKIRGPIVRVLADAMTPKLFDKRRNFGRRIDGGRWRRGEGAGPGD
jgi:hypothetical protein